MNFFTLTKNLLLSLFVASFLNSCNEQEFYEKEYLVSAAEVNSGTGDFEENERNPNAESSSSNSDRPSSSDSNSSDSNSSDSNSSDSNSSDSNSSDSNSSDSNSSDSNSSDSNSSDSNSSDSNSSDSNSSDSNSSDSSSSDSSSSDSSSSDSSSSDSSSSDSNSSDSNSSDSNSSDSNSNSSNSNSSDSNSSDSQEQENLCQSGNPVDAQDEFTQNSRESGKVDILWVVDNSGSMRDEQQALANNFDTFINDFITKGIDFKMGITTTDATNGISGQMIGDSSLLTDEYAASDETSFKNNFKNWIKVGTTGSPREKGFSSSSDFFSRYSDFVRDDAYLIVVYVSDEEEQSSATVESYQNFYDSLKSQVGLFKAYSIVKTQNAIGSESIGTRYLEMSSNTAGGSADIDDNFHTILGDFGTSILNLLDSFPLSSDPINQEIQVTVNGSELNNGWSYQADSRTIKFDENSIPSEGSIVIAYYQKCE